MLRTKQAKGEKYNITADNTENKTFFFFLIKDHSVCSSQRL